MSYNLSNSGFKVGAADPYVVGGVDVALADGGTGASDAAGARTNLGLGSMATQAAGAVAITGGTMANVTITGLPAPVSANDAARKADVDAAKQGLDAKDSVRVVTIQALPGYTRTGNVITASANGALSVDGVAVAVNDRVLVKDGAAAADNGIYDVTATGGAGALYVLTRSVDADTSAKVTTGMYCFVSEGSFADSSWVLTTNDVITLNTTGLAFTQFSGAGQITAGNGLTKLGNTLDVGAGDGIQSDADAITVKLDGTTLAKGASGLKVSTGGINTNELANNAVDTAKLANNAVTAGKINVGGISAANQFAAGVVDSAALASAAVSAGKIAVGGVSAANQLAANVVDSAALADNAVDSGAIAAGAVIAGKYGAGSIATADIANNAVDAGKANLSVAWAHTGALSANGGFFQKVTVTNVSYTVLAADVFVGVTDTTAARTITLPALSGNTGRTLVIKDMSGAAATNNITIDGNGAETIDGATTKLINANYGSITLIGDVGGWQVV
jgi:hypothetical protein